MNVHCRYPLMYPVCTRYAIIFCKISGSQKKPYAFGMASVCEEVQEVQESRVCKRARTAVGLDFSVMMELLPKLHGQIHALKTRMEQQSIDDEEIKVKRQAFQKAFGPALRTADSVARSSGVLLPPKFMRFHVFDDLVEPGDSYKAMYLQGTLNSIWRKVEKDGKTEFVSVPLPADFEVIDLT